MIQFNLAESRNHPSNNKHVLCGFPLHLRGQTSASSSHVAPDVKSLRLPAPQSMQEHSRGYLKSNSAGVQQQSSLVTNSLNENAQEAQSSLYSTKAMFFWNECCIPLFFLATSSSQQQHQQLQTREIRQHYFVVLWCTRFSCFFNLLPLVILFGREDSMLLHSHNATASPQWNLLAIPTTYLGSSDGGMRLASCLYLAFMPISSCFLQIFCFMHSSVDSMQLRIVTCLLCSLSLLSGNIAAILFIAMPHNGSVAIAANISSTKKHWNLPFFFLSLSFSLGSIQLLLLLRKTSILRIMFCTATAVSVITMCILAFQTSSLQNGKRFYQTTALPFMLLFFETTRSHYTFSSSTFLDHGVA